MKPEPVGKKPATKTPVEVPKPPDPAKFPSDTERFFAEAKAAGLLVEHRTDGSVDVGRPTTPGKRSCSVLVRFVSGGGMRNILDPVASVLSLGECRKLLGF